MNEILQSIDGAEVEAPKAPRNDLEHREQVALFEWLAFKTNQDPLFGLVYAVPNGGNRDAVTAARLKDEGVKPGMPDICWPVPKVVPNGRRGVYCGMYIELKPTGYRMNDVSTHQIAVSVALGFAYSTTICIGLDEARDVIETYDALPFPEWFNVEGARRAAADYLAAVDAMRERRRFGRPGLRGGRRNG